MRLPSYPTYRPSGVHYLAEIPSAWQTAPVKRRYKAQLGKMLQNEPASEADILVPYLKALHVLWGKVNITDLPEMWASAGEVRQFGVRGGDLLVCEGGEAGRAGVLQSAPEPCIIQNAVHRVRGRGADVRYLQYVLHSVGSAGWFDVLCNRATISHLTGEKLAELRLPLPSLNEQRAIADFLDRETARVDALVAKKQALIEKLREKRGALVSEVVTRGLPPEAARATGLDPRPRLKPSGIEWLGDVPEHWKLLQLRRVVERFIDYRGRTPTKTDDGIPLVTAGAIRDGAINHSLAPEYMAEDDYGEWMRRGLPELGDVVITTEAPLGEVAQVHDTRVAFAQRVILFKVNRHRMAPEFLRYYYLSRGGRDELLSRASGSTASGIRADRLRMSLVVVPPLGEQEQIVDYLDGHTTALSAPLPKVEAGIAHLQEYRAALITAAVTGKIDVRGYHQDANPSYSSNARRQCDGTEADQDRS